MCKIILRYWVGHHNSKVIEMLAHIWEKELVFFINNNQINRTIGALVYHNFFF
jgi:hypothetical protein